MDGTQGAAGHGVVVSLPKGMYTARRCKCDSTAWCVAFALVFFVGSLAAMIACAVVAGTRVVDCPVATCNVTDASVLPVRFVCTTADGAVLENQRAGPVYAYPAGRVYRAIGCALALGPGCISNAVVEGQYRVWPLLAQQTSFVLDSSADQPGARWTPVTADDSATLDVQRLALRTVVGMQCVWGAAWMAGCTALGVLWVGIALYIGGVPCRCAP